MGELIFTRKRNQGFSIGSDITVRIKEIRAGGEISIAVTAPNEIKILRDDAKKAAIIRHSRFAVRQSRMTGNWYAVDELTKMYLHDDGTLQIEATPVGDSSGYYASERQAWDQVSQWEDSQP